MKRRHALAALAAAGTGGIAGCVSQGGPGDDASTETEDRATEDRATEDSTGTDGDDDGLGSAVAPSVSGTEFDGVADCAGEGEASVTTAPDDAVDVVGCAVGANGCSRVTLGDVGYDESGDALRIVVRTVEDTEDGENCTQALEPLGYDLQVRFDGGLPARVVVAHDDARGTANVADITLRETETPSASQ